MKKMMGKLALLSFGGAAMLSGCGEAGVEAVKTVESEKTTVEYEKEYEYVNPYEYYTNEDEIVYLDEIYNLYKIDDSTAKLDISLIYDENYTSKREYTGSFEQEGDYIRFKYDAMDVSFVFELESDTIVNMQEFFGEAVEEDISGVYTASTEEYGDVTLEVFPFAMAKMTTASGLEFKGYVVIFDDSYDFMANATISEGETEYIDWYVNFGTDTFGYTPFGDTLGEETGALAGDYSLFGDLGEILISVTETDEVYATVNIDGAEINMTGYAYDYEGIGFPTEVDLYTDDDSYSLNLEINQLEDGTLNYSGSIKIRKTLAAG